MRHPQVELALKELAGLRAENSAAEADMTIGEVKAALEQLATDYAGVAGNPLCHVMCVVSHAPRLAAAIPQGPIAVAAVLASLAACHGNCK